MTTRQHEPGWPKGDHLSAVAPGSQIAARHIKHGCIASSIRALHAAERQTIDRLAFIVATQGVNRRAGE